MNKNEDLELCKAFAELEGVIYVKDKRTNRIFDSWQDTPIQGIVADHEYNPIIDLALNCAARDKYCVDIEYSKRHIDGIVAIDETRIYFSTKETKPRAVIECILKSEGKL